MTNRYSAGPSEQTKAAALACLVLIWTVVTAGVAIYLFWGRSFETSWGQRIKRGEEYLTIKDQTLTQDDLERVAALKHLHYLELIDCNVAECRLPDVEFASHDLRNVSLEGTTGLWDLSFLKRLPATDLSLARCKEVSDLGQLNWDVLQKLDVSDTEITSLAPMAGSQLWSLAFARTQVSDLTPLQELDSLWKVDGSYTQVRSLDAIAPLRSLGSINFGGCPLTEVETPFTARYLDEINLAETPVRNLEGLSGCQSVRVLNVGGCKQLTSMDWLNRQCCERLERLNVGRTGVDPHDLEWIASCTKMRSLSIDATELKDLSLCQNLRELTYLSAVGCGLTSLSGIESCKELETVLVGYNQLSNLAGLPTPPDEWPEMVVDVSHNQLTSVADLPLGSYRCLLLQGNGPDAGRTVPAGVESYNVVADWFSGVDDSRLSDYQYFNCAYLLSAPAEVISQSYSNHWSNVTYVSEDELLDMLEHDALGYGLYVDMSSYIAYAREVGSGQTADQ